MGNRKQISVIEVDPRFTSSLTKKLLTHGWVRIADFGVFSLKKNSVGYLPSTKEKKRHDYIKIKFEPHAKFKQKVKKWKE